MSQSVWHSRTPPWQERGAVDSFPCGFPMGCRCMGTIQAVIMPWHAHENLVVMLQLHILLDSHVIHL